MPGSGGYQSAANKTGRGGILYNGQAFLSEAPSPSGQGTEYSVTTNSGGRTTTTDPKVAALWEWAVANKIPMYGPIAEFLAFWANYGIYVEILIVVLIVWLIWAKVK